MTDLGERFSAAAGVITLVRYHIRPALNHGGETVFGVAMRRSMQFRFVGGGEDPQGGWRSRPADAMSLGSLASPRLGGGGRVRGPPRKLRGPMRLTTVQFNDCSPFSPKTIRFDFESVEVERDVELGLGQVGAGEQCCEPSLKVAAGPAPGPATEAVQADPERGRSPPSGVSVHQRLEALELKSMEVFRLANRRFQRFWGESGGNVEKGSGRASSLESCASRSARPAQVERRVVESPQKTALSPAQRHQSGCAPVLAGYPRAPPQSDG